MDVLGHIINDVTGGHRVFRGFQQIRHTHPGNPTRTNQVGLCPSSIQSRVVPSKEGTNKCSQPIVAKF